MESKVVQVIGLCYTMDYLIGSFKWLMNNWTGIPVWAGSQAKGNGVRESE